MSETIGVRHALSCRYKNKVPPVLILTARDGNKDRARNIAEDSVGQLQDKAVSAGNDLEYAAPETAVGVNAVIRFLMLL